MTGFLKKFFKIAGTNKSFLLHSTDSENIIIIISFVEFLQF